jgi:hypothetical protein
MVNGQHKNLNGIVRNIPIASILTIIIGTQIQQPQKLQKSSSALILTNEIKVKAMMQFVNEPVNNGQLYGG